MAGESEDERGPDRGRWVIGVAVVMVVVGAAVLSTLLIAGGSSSSEVEFLPGKTIEVPNDLGDLSRQEALIAVLDGVSKAAGYADEFRNCVAGEIQGLSESELTAPTGQGGSPKRTDQLFSASGRCSSAVDPVVAPDATAEQLSFLRELTATQIGDLVALLPNNAALVDCVPAKIRALGDTALRELVDGPGGLADSIERLERDCRAAARGSGGAA